MLSLTPIPMKNFAPKCCSANGEDSIPQEVEHGGKLYTIEVIKKEAPDEMVSFSRAVLRVGDFRQFAHFFYGHLAPMIGFPVILFWNSPWKMLASVALVIGALKLEYFVYWLHCRNSQRSCKTLFPHIKVSDDSGVLTTMTPKAYVGQLDIVGLDFPVPILPLVVSPTGHRHMFSMDRFGAAIESAEKARAERQKTHSTEEESKA